MTCIPSTCGSIGVNTAFLVEDTTTTDVLCAPATFDANSNRFEILQENIQYTDVLLGGNGLTGTLDRIGIHTRHGARVVRGSFTMEVGPNELEYWLPKILATTDVVSPFSTEETFTQNGFDIMIKRDAATAVYRNCLVASASFSCRSSIEGPDQVLRMTLNVIGFEEHLDQSYPVTPPALPSTERLYWLLGDAKLQLTGTAEYLTRGGTNRAEHYFDAFNLVIDNGLAPKLRNFLQVTCIQSQGRRIALRVTTPYTADSDVDLYENFFTGSAVLSFLSSKSDETPATYNTVFTLPDVRQTRVTPNTRGPGEIPLFLDFEAYRSSGVEPLTVAVTT